MVIAFSPAEDITEARSVIIKKLEEKDLIQQAIQRSKMDDKNKKLAARRHTEKQKLAADAADAAAARNVMLAVGDCAIALGDEMLDEENDENEDEVSDTRESERKAWVGFAQARLFQTFLSDFDI